MAIAKVLTQEQQRQHEELYDRFVASTAHAGDMLKRHGVNSKEFHDADLAAGELSEQILRLIGKRSWMS